MITLNINTDASVVFTNKLEKLHRSALPNAVRGALNKAAFDVKQNTMPASATKAFVNRQPNFFKATSRVEMARGWSIDQMSSVVGFIETGLKGENNFAVKDLEQQERGGTIGGRSFVPMDRARGGSHARPVRPGNRLSTVNNVVNSNKSRGNKKQNFLKAVYKAGAGGFVIGNNEPKVLWKINSITRLRGRLRVSKTPLYLFKEHRSFDVKPKGFMESASLQSGRKIELFYVAEAKRQIDRLTK